MCPNEIFSNTKMDLGVCHKIHSPALKADYEMSKNRKDYHFEYEHYEVLKGIIADCDRKIEYNKRKLEENKDEFDSSAEAAAVHEINEQIGCKLAKAELIGNAGDVQGSMEIMKEVEELKNNKKILEDIYKASTNPMMVSQQKLRVCEVCGAFLSLYDNDRRLADHFGGKLHIGFIKLRERYHELDEAVRIDREKDRIEREERRKKEEAEKIIKEAMKASEKRRSPEKKRDSKKRDDDSSESESSKKKEKRRSEDRKHKKKSSRDENGEKKSKKEKKKSSSRRYSSDSSSPIHKKESRH